MKGGGAFIAGAGGTLLVGGLITSLVSTGAMKVATMVTDSHKRKTAPPCSVCNGARFVPCDMCRGSSAISWSPFEDPQVKRLCVCPTCDGVKEQRCLNCLGKGFT
eukprot:jgi/Mesvir1/16321/Mv09815-RA.1